MTKTHNGTSYHDNGLVPPRARGAITRAPASAVGIVVAVAGLIGLQSGCVTAYQSVTPRSWVQFPLAGGDSVTLPAPGGFAHTLAIQSQYDPALDSSRISVVLQRSRYVLWIQRPRITAYFEYDGASVGAVPGEVFIEIRTQMPQQPARSVLLLDGSGPRVVIENVVYRRGSDTPLTSNRFFTFAVPISDFAGLLAGGRIALDVGGVMAVLGPGQVEALRDLASRMAPVSGGPG